MNGLIFPIPFKAVKRLLRFFEKYDFQILLYILTVISVFSYAVYFSNGLGLSYNDARSHLDIGRRVVESLKPGLAQLGSVWLPLPHLLMVPTVWNDFMWHSGLSGALQSMVSFVATGMMIYYYLKRLSVPALGRLTAVVVFCANLNILYLQSTAMTELLLIATMTAASFELLVWYQREKLLNLVMASFWVMLATLIRYDGWFLLFMMTVLIFLHTLKKSGFKTAEGRTIFFMTLGSLGVALWFLWNLVIFKDPLYFIYGPYSAYTQQTQLEEAGNLATKGNLLFSIKVYTHALLFNSNTFIVLLGLLGSIFFFLNKKFSSGVKLASFSLLAPLIFNILALYLGQSVLFIQGLSGNTWFNVRYGIMLAPAIAIFTGYLVGVSQKLKYVLVGLILLVSVFTFTSQDAVTIDDARVGSSQKNVSEVSGWMRKNITGKEGFVLISAASHDAIIFSSGLQMKKFIHEGTGAYWIAATSAPDRWARWIIMRTNDVNDLTFKELAENKALQKYNLVEKYPFADIYEIKDEYVNQLNTSEMFPNQR